jgi:biotin/methionine sulfoxide reductase
MLTHWGPQLIESDGTTVTRVLAHPTDPDPAVIATGMEAATECRVAKPSIRKSWLEGGPGTATERRGTDPFVEVEWDVALDLVARELVRTRAEVGCESIFAGSYGWGSAGRFHAPSNQLYRFLRMFGGYTDIEGTYSAMAALTVVPYIIGLNYYQAIGQQTSWSVTAANTELFVSFGSLRMTNTQVTYGGQGPHYTRPWVKQAVAQGVEFVNVGPVRDDEWSEADGRWLPVRPSTDVALMLGLAHTLETEGLADLDFLERCTEGWPTFRAYVLGTEDGQPKTAAWASEITGVPVDDIAALAREMAAKRTTINLSLSVQRTDHGEQSYWMAFALASMLGQIGLPGGGVAFPFGAQGNTGSGQRRKRIPGLPIPPQATGMPVISVSRVTEMLENPGQPTQYNGRDMLYPDIKVVYWVGGNPFHHHQDLNRFTKAWQKPETVIVHEPFWNSIAKRADIVLPATTPLERNDLGGGDTILVAMQRAIDPLGDAKDDYGIFSELAARVDLAEVFTEGRSADEWVRHLYDEFAEANSYAKPFDEFWDDGWVEHADMGEMGKPQNVFLSAFRQDPDANPLPTPSGRIELFSSTVAAFGYDDCPGHPAWMEPYERLGSTQAEQFPLHLVSNQPTHRLHSQFDHGPASRSTKIQGREPARLHPDDAAARGIKDGDVIRVFNNRGACLAGVKISDALMPGIVQLATGAWFDPDEDGTCKNGNPNVLTRDKGTSKLAQGPSAHTCLVQVEHFEGEPPPVTAYDPPLFSQ